MSDARSPPRSIEDAVILAGGESRRMGREKALVELEGATLLARVARGLASRFDRIWLSCRSDGPSTALKHEVERLGAEEGIALRLVLDEREVAGPLAGIESALARISGDAALFVAVDVPVLDLELIDRLVAASPGHRGVVPWANNRPEPTLAVYAGSLRSTVSLRIDEGRLRLRDIARLDGVARIDGASALARGAFETLNTPGDLDRCQARLGRLAVSDGPETRDQERSG